MSTRREFLKKTGYIAPVILTLSATPSFAGSGSHRGNPASPSSHGNPQRGRSRKRRSKGGNGHNGDW
jgi:hypothetical protein